MHRLFLSIKINFKITFLLKIWSVFTWNKSNTSIYKIKLPNNNVILKTQDIPLLHSNTPLHKGIRARANTTRKNPNWAININGGTRNCFTLWIFAKNGKIEMLPFFYYGGLSLVRCARLWQSWYRPWGDKTDITSPSSFIPKTCANHI